MVEPADPFECGEFDGFKGTPWSTPVDHLGCVEAMDGIGQGIGIAQRKFQTYDAMQGREFFDDATEGACCHQGHIKAKNRYFSAHVLIESTIRNVTAGISKGASSKRLAGLRCRITLSVAGI